MRHGCDEDIVVLRKSLGFIVRPLDYEYLVNLLTVDVLLIEKQALGHFIGYSYSNNIKFSIKNKIIEQLI